MGSPTLETSESSAAARHRDRGQDEWNLLSVFSHKVSKAERKTWKIQKFHALCSYRSSLSLSPHSNKFQSNYLKFYLILNSNNLSFCGCYVFFFFGREDGKKKFIQSRYLHTTNVDASLNCSQVFTQNSSTWNEKKKKRVDFNIKNVITHVQQFIEEIRHIIQSCRRVVSHSTGKGEESG